MVTKTKVVKQKGKRILIQVQGGSFNYFTLLELENFGIHIKLQVDSLITSLLFPFEQNQAKKLFHVLWILFIMICLI